MLTSKIFCGILLPMSTLNDHQENKILTQVKKVDAQHPDMTIIREAAEIIRTGWLVSRQKRYMDWEQTHYCRKGRKEFMQQKGVRLTIH